MEYNSQRNHLTMKEYGRHIQKMVEYIKTIPDRMQRQSNAEAAIELMGFLNPHLKNVEDFSHKLWDHLFLIADFNLDVDSPYPIPTRESIKAKPAPLPYPKRYPKFNHLGKNIEIVIDKALKEEDAEKRQGFANSIAYYMKLTYSTWHNELLHDDNIQTELADITEGQLEFNNRPFVKHRTDNRNTDDYGSAGGRNNYRKNFSGRNNNNRNNNNRNNNNRNNSNRSNNNRSFKKRY
jgi:hypothetical protein